MANLNMYELTYIVNASLGDEPIKDMVARVTKYITENGGEVLDVDEWGNKRLAYPINKKRNGYYVNVFYKAPGSMLVKFERAMEINDNILRYLNLRMDAKMIRHYERQKATPVAAAAE